jgi:NTP pyrophosphatase (non-canonical NTP hydrolase)
MDMKQLLDDITRIHEYFLQRDVGIDAEKHTLLSSMKLTEEVGELNEQILGYYGHGRKEKVEKYTPEDLEHEIADVIFSALIVAKELNVDVEKAMTKKMEKIKERFQLQ